MNDFIFFKERFRYKFVEQKLLSTKGVNFVK